MAGCAAASMPELLSLTRAEGAAYVNFDAPPPGGIQNRSGAGCRQAHGSDAFVPSGCRTRSPSDRLAVIAVILRGDVPCRASSA